MCKLCIHTIAVYTNGHVLFETALSKDTRVSTRNVGICSRVAERKEEEEDGGVNKGVTANCCKCIAHKPHGGHRIVYRY